MKIFCIAIIIMVSLIEAQNTDFFGISGGVKKYPGHDKMSSDFFCPICKRTFTTYEEMAQDQNNHFDGKDMFIIARIKILYEKFNENRKQLKNCDDDRKTLDGALKNIKTRASEIRNNMEVIKEKLNQKQEKIERIIQEVQQQLPYLNQRKEIWDKKCQDYDQSLSTYNHKVGTFNNNYSKRSLNEGEYETGKQIKNQLDIEKAILDREENEILKEKAELQTKLHWVIGKAEEKNSIISEQNILANEYNASQKAMEELKIEYGKWLKKDKLNKDVSIKLRNNIQKLNEEISTLNK